MNYLITIIGPTAIGKTALSIAIAKHFKCSIFSCDSRQFFKEMKIGTAVPNKDELNAANHFFIQNKSIFDNYSVGNYETEILNELNKEFAKNNIQALVGGSGLYVNAVLNGFDDFPNIDFKIREQINTKFELFGLEYLQNEFKKLNSDYYTKILHDNPQTLQNPQRLKRFIEVSLGTGKPYSSFLNSKNNTRNFIPICIGLEAERSILYSRINKRVDLMIEMGLVNEAKNLFEFKNLNALQTVGYKELFDYFEGNCTIENAIENIKMNTRRFAKRQMTWFKKMESVTWFDFETNTNDIIFELEKKLL